MDRAAYHGGKPNGSHATAIRDACRMDPTTPADFHPGNLREDGGEPLPSHDPALYASFDEQVERPLRIQDAMLARTRKKFERRSFEGGREWYVYRGY